MLFTSRTKNGANMDGRKNERIPFGVLDFETDPFRYGRVPFPFACGLYFGENSYSLLWGDNILEDTLRAIRSLPRCILYAHNGGKFDFFYLVEFANKGKCLVRNGRIFEMQIGNVTLRDSWPLMPFALEEYRKTKIDYRIFEENEREKPQNKLRIQTYLYDDCRNLYELISGFKEILGPKDTIGSAAFYQMRKLGIEIESLNETHDEQFRPYFFGGRVEAFKQGVFHGQFQYLDINSAYPYAMLFNHPHGADYSHSKRLPKGRNSGEFDSGHYFVSLTGHSKGALPLRNSDGSLGFPHGVFHFLASGWEVVAGLETETLRIDKIHDVWMPKNTINFRPFVEKFYPLKQQAKRDKKQIEYLAYKYALNSGFGKHAQNPRDFKEYILWKFGEYPRGRNDWQWETDYGSLSLFSRSNYDGFGFYDVATGASITGFNRAKFWRGACASRGLLYGDTDALCAISSKVRISPALGDWKHEGIATEACIAGKKLYALRWDKETDGEKYKIACKGARLSYSQIKSMCHGNTVTWENPAPTFSATLGATFVKRRLKSTGKV